MLGHSICQLYETQEETMEHLINSYNFTSRLWDAFANIFQQFDRDKESITNTLNRWRRNFSDNEALNLAWALVPNFIIWNIWKERNKRIFKNEKNLDLHLFDQILKQIKETISSTIRNLPKNPPLGVDLRTLRLLGMKRIIPLSHNRTTSKKEFQKEYLQRPPRGFLKYNIDGASKGNPGITGFRGGSVG